MRYAVLLFGDEKAEQALPRAELDRIVAEHVALSRELAAAGKLVSGEGLLPTDTATTVRDGVVTDGPFLDSREHIGGIYVIDVADLDEAIAVAKRVPDSPGLAVEIRPVMS